MRRNKPFGKTAKTSIARRSGCKTAAIARRRKPSSVDAAEKIALLERRLYKSSRLSRPRQKTLAIVWKSEFATTAPV